MTLMLVGVLLYYIQSKEGLFDILRPYVIIYNIAFIAWFICLQVFRFKETGRACSGDFIEPAKPGEKEKYPPNYDTVYLGQQGLFLIYYIIAQYVIGIIFKIY